MRYANWQQALLVAGALAMQSGLAHSAPEVGWWWNPNESGRGFFVESQNGIVYLAGYFYESDGRATWLVSGGQNGDPYSFDGRLLKYRNGQTLFGDYQPPAAPADMGAVSLHFSDDTHGAITWPGGTIPIQRQRFGGADAPFQPDSGWWWNPDEGGRGYSVEVQGDSMFVVGFMYDASGDPVWYYSAGKMASPTTYQGALLQFANGQTLAGPYQPPTPPAAVGQLSLEFGAIDEATLTITDDVPTAGGTALKKSTIWTRPIKREFPAKPFPLPARYDGTFIQTTVQTRQATALGHYDSTYVLTAKLTWIVSEITGLDLRVPRETYELLLNPDEMPISVKYRYKEIDPVNGTCEGTFEKSFSLSDVSSFLEVSGWGQSFLSLHVKPETEPLPVQCTSLTDVTMHIDTDSRKASMVYGIQGEETTEFRGTKTTVSWSFAAVKKTP